jgi:apolipoprotein N-acyltransferase
MPKAKPTSRSERKAGKAAARAAEPTIPRPRQALELGLALFCGILLFSSCEGWNLWWNAWFAFVPVLWMIDRAPTARRARRLSWLTGIVANAGGFYWIIALLERFARLPWPLAALLFLLLAAYQALVFWIFGHVVYRLRRTTALPMALIAPVVMVGFELIVPMLFPWYLAITQAWNVHVIQIADLTGPLGVSFLLLMINGGIYDLLSRRRAGLRPAAIAVAALAAALIYGHVRIDQVEAARARAAKLEVGIVQPNIAFDKKLASRPEQVKNLQACSAEAERQGADLIVWTESAFPFAIERQSRTDLAEKYAGRIRRGFTVPLFMGAITYDQAGGDSSYPYNSAMLLDRDGSFSARFDKMYLLMFGEYIPGLETFPFLRKYMPKAAGQFAHGHQVLTFPFKRAEDPPEAPPWRLGPLICYEDIIPAFGRNLARLHPHLLVNITNDSWFGATAEPWEHMQLAIFRAVELRTDMVRAVNTGVSSFISASGRVIKTTYSIDPATQQPPASRRLCGVSPGAMTDVEVGQVVLMEGGHTVYAVIGDVFGILMLVLTVLLWQVVPRLRRKA